MSFCKSIREAMRSYVVTILQASAFLLFAAISYAQEQASTIEFLKENARNGAIASPIARLERSQLHDSFNELHNGHLHHAIDIMEPRGTPVRAAVNGTIRKLFYSAGGGNTIYEFDEAQQFCYYYAHLDSYAANLHDGSRVSQGETIGYVGSSGDASADAPHLHFAIYQLGPQKRWWQGVPLDPYPVLAQAVTNSHR
jgi:murein DD-endopeptidase MepM/ murein hydrolase activator NlpD